MTRVVLTLMIALLPSLVWAFPDNGVLDTFTGCIDTTTPPNANWTTAVLIGATSAALECHDQAVASVGGVASGDGYYNVITTNADSEVYATILNVADASQGGVYGRLVQIGANTTDGYGVDWLDGSSLLSLNRLDNGVKTTLGSDDTQAIAVGDKVGLRMEGDQICIWFWDASGAASWVEIRCETDANHTAGGRIGLNLFNTTTGIGTWDDFGGGNLAVASTRKPSAPILLQ